LEQSKTASKPAHRYFVIEFVFVCMKINVLIKPEYKIFGFIFYEWLMQQFCGILYRNFFHFGIL